MRNYKFFLISFVFFIFIIGAVSASEVSVDNNISTVDEDSLGDIIIDPIIPIDPFGPGGDDEPSDVVVDTKEIYVNSTGDDSNLGTKESPYASVNKAFSDVNASNNATIYIGEGTFLFNGTSKYLNINLNHKVYGGNLKFIGAGADKTILDGQATYYFATIGSNANVTIKDLTIVNCKNNNGGTIVNNGKLTVDNCIFKDSQATVNRGGVITSSAGLMFGGEKPYLSVINSQFISPSINDPMGMKITMGGAIYAQYSNLYLENNTFINIKSTKKGSAVYLQNTETHLINNKFINIVGASEDASIYVLHDSNDIMCPGDLNYYIIGNEFINCSNPSDTYSIVNLNSGNINFENNIFINSTNSVGNIYIETASISSLEFKMNYTVINISNADVNKGFILNQFKITDDMDNIVRLPSLIVNMNNDENSISIPCTVENGEIKVIFSDVPENGLYNLTFSYGELTSDVLSVINVSLVTDPVELWVSPDGDDWNSGTQSSPLATIETAIDVGFDKSFNVIIHLLNGTYSKEGNVKLTVAYTGNLQILGEKYNETIIDGENDSWFLSASTTNVLISNLKFINGYNNGYLVDGGNKLVLENCIFDNNKVSLGNNNYAIIGAIKLDKLYYINSCGRISVSNCNITDSIFENCNFSSNINDQYNQDNAILIVNNGIIENSRFINNIGRTGIVYGNFTSKKNYYADNYATLYGGAVYAIGNCQFINDRFVNNRALSEGGAIASGSKSLNTYLAYEFNPLLNFENCTFINNSATTGGAVATISKYASSNIVHAEDTFLFEFNECKFINNSATKGGAVSFRIGNFTDCFLINNTADYGGAFYLVPHIVETNNDNEFNNIIFENNIAVLNGNDIYLEKPSNWAYGVSNLVYRIPLTITFNDLNVHSLVDNLSATVYGPCGAIIGTNYLSFNLNESNIGDSEVVNSVATFKYNGFEEGNYILNGNIKYPNPKNIINNGNILVKLELLDHVDVWVSIDGSDENGNGSQNNPFKSILHAMEEANKNCRDITIYISEGVFTGDLNTALTISAMNNITFVGAGVGKTIIDGENTNYFANIIAGKNKVVFDSLTIQNMLPVNVESIISSNIQNIKTIEGIPPITIDEGASLYLNNVNINNCHGANSIIENNGNLVINNSKFNNNGISGYLINGGNITIDNSLFDENFALSSLIKGIVNINNSEIKNAFNLKSLWLIEGTKTIIENTNISNDGDNSSLKKLGYNNETDKLRPAITIGSYDIFANNISMIFNSNLNYDTVSPFGIALVNRNILVYNSEFRNFDYLWGNYYAADIVVVSFDGCLFDNITVIANKNTPSSIEVQYNITNSVFIQCGAVIEDQNINPHNVDALCNFENNYWGSNEKPVVTVLNSKGQSQFEPSSWIILAIEDEEIVFKVTDGENTTAYEGTLPAEIAYVTDETGNVIPVVDINGDGYLLAVDGEGNLMINTSADPIKGIVPLVPANETVFANDVSLKIGEVAVFTANFTDKWGNPLKNTIVSFIIGETPFTKTTDDNGTASFDIDFGLGAYNVVVTNPATSQNISRSIRITTDDTIDASDVTVKYGDAARFIANFTDEYGVALANTNVTFKVGNGVVNAITDANGTASFDIDLKPGIFGVEIINPVTGQSISKTIAVTVAETISASDVTATYGDAAKFIATFTDEFSKALSNVTVTFKVGENTINATTDANGTASFDVNFDAGKYNVTITNPVTGQSITKAITVNQIATKLSAAKVTTTYNVAKNLVITLTDANGKALSNVKVILNINGKNTPVTTDKDGKAKYSVKLPAKTYTATITYAGDNNHVKSTASAKVVVNKASPKMVAKKKTFKTKTKKYTITLKDNKGKAMKKVKVTLTTKVKGKKVKLTVKTKNNGKATFNLKKLVKGKYTASVKFAGNKNFKAATKKVKITVKK